MSDEIKIADYKGYAIRSRQKPANTGTDLSRPGMKFFVKKGDWYVEKDSQTQIELAIDAHIGDLEREKMENKAGTAAAEAQINERWPEQPEKIKIQPSLFFPRREKETERMGDEGEGAEKKGHLQTEGRGGAEKIQP